MYLIKWLLFPVGGSQALSVGGVCRRCSGRRSVSGSLRGALADLGLWVQAEALWSSAAHQERPGAIQAGPRGCPTWASDAAGPAVGVSELVGLCVPLQKGRAVRGRTAQRGMLPTVSSGIWVPRVLMAVRLCLERVQE